MRARLVAVIALCAGIGCGSTRPCKEGSVLVDVSIAGAGASTPLTVATSLDGAAPVTNAVTATGGSGSFEIDFSGAYPTGHRLTITVTAPSLDEQGSATVTLVPGCTQLEIAVTVAIAQDMTAPGDAATPPDATAMVDGSVDGSVPLDDFAAPSDTSAMPTDGSPPPDQSPPAADAASPDQAPPVDATPQDQAPPVDATPQDQAPPVDAAAPRDLTIAPDLSPLVTTAHAIDTGQVPSGTVARITGLTLTAPEIFLSKNGVTGVCRYIAFGQDASGAPDGLELFATVTEPVTDGGLTCPALGATGTPLDGATTIGDVLTVEGTVFVTTTTTTQHSLTVTSLTRSGTATPPAPVVFGDGTQFAQGGAGYAQYENMLVKLAPNGGFTVSGPVNGFGDFTGDNAYFLAMYQANYPLPSAGQSFKSITGVATPAFNGGVTARQASDFQ